MGSDRKQWVLVGTCVGLFLLMLDSTVVTLALPSIQHDLDASSSELQWVLNGYLLALAVLVVTLGRLGDMFGRRKIFLLGVAVFAAGSVVSAVSGTIEVLIAGRLTQGAGAAALMGLSLALVNDAFPLAERRRAVGIWTAVSSVALAVGPIIGGLLVDDVGWRWIFWINLPFCLLGAVITLASARESRDEEAGHRIDFAGILTLTVGLGGLVLALVQGRTWGWSSAATLASLAVGIAGLAAFAVVERRVQSPIIDLTLFRNKSYAGASAAGFAVAGCYWAVMFVQPQYLQNALGHSPLAAGALILPITAPMVVLSGFSGALLQRFGPRLVMTLGLALEVVGLFLLTRIGAHTDLAPLLTAYTIFGISLPLVYAPMSSAAMEAMPEKKAGIASSVLAMNRVAAGVICVALTGAVFQRVEHQRLAHLDAARHAGLSLPQRHDLEGLLAGAPSAKRAVANLGSTSAHTVESAVRTIYSDALASSMWVLVAIAALGCALTWLLVTKRRAGAAAAEPAPAAVAAGHHRHRFHL